MSTTDASTATGADDSGSDDGGGSTGGAADGGSSSGGDETGDPNMDLDGEELFVGYCAACHGLQAQGTALGYELRHPSRPFATWVTRNGRPGDEFPTSEMAAFNEQQLSDDQLQLIFDHLDTFEQPTDGAGLYADYCGNCHGDNGLGGVVHKNISDQGDNDIFEKVREGEGGSNYGARLSYMPRFDAATLSDAEVQLIADFLVP